MSAFGHTMTYYINNNIAALYQRRRAIARLQLTHDEYIDTFVPAEARRLFRDITPYNGAEEFARGTIEMRQFGHEGEANIFVRNTQTMPAPPLIRTLELQRDAPPEVVQRIRSWLENGGDVHRDFGLVRHVFAHLNNNYSRAAVRHYWPTIMALCDNNEITKDLVADLQNMKPPANLKPLPPGYIRACRATAATVSTAQLIPHDVTETPVERFERVAIDMRPGQSHNMEGVGTFYGML